MGTVSAEGPKFLVEAWEGGTGVSVGNLKLLRPRPLRICVWTQPAPTPVPQGAPFKPGCPVELPEARLAPSAGLISEQ